ncbi:hypothetical protein CBUD_0244a [Coxiella burnetii Dugway 5J108-111]|uniref:Uncharacterized protein n=1 Tax=Coxiella burnetii (strain Dugway 5J108-111) TaxID=434922 RepID=B5XHP8_COXBN|nr:hypothetical protein CBUD_0244a [Coxiella burnetii Dugway 5J108-111]
MKFFFIKVARMKRSGIREIIMQSRIRCASYISLPQKEIIRALRKTPMALFSAF